MKKIRLNLDRKTVRSYDIHVGHDIMDRAGLLLAKNNWASRYVMISDSCVASLYGAEVLDLLRRMDLKVDLIEFPEGEASKTIHTCLEIMEKMAALGADRRSAVIAVGGGVTGDIAGFTASVFMRGIPCVQIPTTLLAQVDSSVGGKTGVDTADGKNFIGTFHQPKAVFSDISFLKTLPESEIRNGLAEIVKYGIIESPEILALLDEQAEALMCRDAAFLESLILKCCRIKKGIIELDEKETGLRRILNFGHTIGHAVEAESGYRLSHGDAVSIGMAAAVSISARMQYLPAEDRERILSLIRKLGLADRVPQSTGTEGILSRLKKDKKKEGSAVHFVLLKRPGMPFMNGGVPEPLIRETIEGLRG
jgi:3-dehydroquinate synthase